MWQQIKYCINTKMCGNAYLNIWVKAIHWLGSQGGREREQVERTCQVYHKIAFSELRSFPKYNWVKRNMDFFLLLFFKPCLFNLYLIPPVPDCVLCSGKACSKSVSLYWLVQSRAFLRKPINSKDHYFSQNRILHLTKVFCSNCEFK